MLTFRNVSDVVTCKFLFVLIWLVSCSYWLIIIQSVHLSLVSSRLLLWFAYLYKSCVLPWFLSAVMSSRVPLLNSMLIVLLKDIVC